MSSVYTAVDVRVCVYMPQAYSLLLSDDDLPYKIYRVRLSLDVKSVIIHRGEDFISCVLQFAASCV